MRQTPSVLIYRTPVRAAAPQAIGIARSLGALFGRGINGHTGTILYGYPAIGSREKFAGYANTPQLFLGYSPMKVARGAFRGAPGQLPSTSNPVGGNPLTASMAAVTANQLAGQS